MDVRGLVLFLGCLACAFAAPLSDSRGCDTECIVPSGFKDGRTYVYSYSTKTSTFIQGEQYGYSNLTVSCEVRLEVIGTCEIVLELRDISVEEIDRNGNTIQSPNEDDFSNHLTRNRLRFGMQAGKVTSVCPTSAEAPWATNFKRGVLSALQMTLPDTIPGSNTVMESTVSGTCQTEVTAENTESVLKMKDFKLCEDRFNDKPWLLYGTKLVPTAPTSTIMVSEQQCRQELHSSGKYLTSSECEEIHILKPVSDQETGPATLVRQSLTFNTITKERSNHQLESIEERKSIVFEHHKHMEQSKTDDSLANDIISHICETLSGGVDIYTAKLYPALVNEMRKLESSTLAGVLASAVCEDYPTTLKQILRDALGECKSSGCIEVIVNLIEAGTIQDQNTMQKWIYTLNFIDHPTKDMVSHLMRLLEEQTEEASPIRATLSLAVSTIIKKYCVVVNPDCEREDEIDHAIEYFERRLGSRCRYQDKAEKKEMKIAIHALGNAGIPSRTLRKCYETESADMSLRIAAIQAASQGPCESENTMEGLVDILRKSSQDSELRITAYKALMTCPQEGILDFLDRLLNEERSNQVGAYIVSHLKNIQASQDPLKAELRELLADHPITAQFLDDSLKFSKNFELSWYNETTGNGLAGEADIIFSSNSFIPRQIALKGQFDTMGYAFEAFELGGRVEGLQGVLESAVDAFWSPLGEDNDNEETRKKRSLIKDNKLDNLIQDFEVNTDEEVDGSIYLKIFGREMMFMDAEDIKALLTPKDKQEYIMQIAMLAMGQTYETSQTSLLMENSLAVPLMNGLELKFSVNGSTTERLKANGKLNLLGLAVSPRSFEVDGTLEPSSAVDVSFLMQVDAHCARIGVNYDVSAHTATSLSGKIILKEKEQIKLQLRAPEQKQELITISSAVRFLHQEQLDIIPTSSLELTEEKICTGDFLENALGMKICGDSTFHETPEGETPLSGAYQFSLTMEKVEEDLESYDFEVAYELDKNMVGGVEEDTDIFSLYFGTPNTQRYRSYGTTVRIQRANGLTEGALPFSIEMMCPRLNTVSLTLVGSRISKDNHKNLDITLHNAEGHEYFSLYLNFEKSESGDEMNFYPTLRIRTPKFGKLEFAGSVINSPNELRLDMRLEGENRRFVTLLGATTYSRKNSKSVYETNLSIGGEYWEGSIESTLQKRENAVIMDTTLRKGTGNSEERLVTISSKYNSKSGEAFSRDFFITCDFAEYPQINFRLDGDLEVEEASSGLMTSSDIKFCYGQTTCSGNQKIILSHNMDLQLEGSNLNNSLRITLRHPAQGTHLVLSHDAVSRAGHRNFTVSIIDEAESVMLASARLGAEYNKAGSSRQGSIEVSLETANSIKRLNQSWAVQHSGEFTGVNIIQLHNDRSLETMVRYSKSSGHSLDVLTIYPCGKTQFLHVNVEKRENGIASAMVIKKNEEERFSIQSMANWATETGCKNGNGTVRIKTPFHFLSDVRLGLFVHCHKAAGFDASLSFEQIPDQVVHNVSIIHKSSSLESVTDKSTQLVLQLPSSSFTLTGMVHQNESNKEKKVGMLFKVKSEDVEHVYGIEGKVMDHSTDQQKDFFFRINTTVLDHHNAVELTVVTNQQKDIFFRINTTVLDHHNAVELTVVTNQQKDIFFRINTTVLDNHNAVELTVVTNREKESYCLLNIQYSPEGELSTNVSFVNESKGNFTFKVIVEAENQKANLTLRNIFEAKRIFNPHLSIVHTSGDDDLNLLDVDLKLNQSISETNGKNHNLRLAISGPGKTLIFSSGLSRNANGFHYFTEVGNGVEVRLRAELDTAIFVGETFNAAINFSAMSIYAPDWPVQCGIYLEPTAGSIYFNIKDKPLFQFNISNTNEQSLPEIINRDLLTVNVKLPTSINPALHHFGMSFLREDRILQNDLPEMQGSLSFFWGKEPNQQLTISSSMSVENVDGSLQVDGILLLAQPLRLDELQPEYTLDYSLTKQEDRVNVIFTFNHDDGEVSSLDVSHEKRSKEGHDNFITSVTTTVRSGKVFKVSSDVTPKQNQEFESHFEFTTDDGYYQEEAELGINLRNLSPLDLDRSLEITFEHSPSGMDVTSHLSLQNSDSVMYFGVEGDCSLPSMVSSLRMQYEIQLDKTTKTLMVHSLGPANNIILRANVYDLTEGEKYSYRLETNNEINGAPKTCNVQVDFDRTALSSALITETSRGQHAIKFRYLNDSSIQVSLDKDDHQNAQTTLTVLNPHTLYTLITWDTTWPATLNVTVRERLESMKEKALHDVSIYSETFQNISENFESYLANTYMWNSDMLEKMEVIKDGLNETLTRIKENYRQQRQTIEDKFRTFKENARENLTPLIEEYEEMGATSCSYMNDILSIIRERVKPIFEAKSQASASFEMPGMEILKEHVRSLKESARHNIELDLEMWEDYKAQREIRRGCWVEEIDRMRASWQESKLRFLTGWRSFKGIMDGTIGEIEFSAFENMVQNPLFLDAERIFGEMLEVKDDINEELERIRMEDELRRELMRDDIQALRSMKVHFRTVNNVPSIGIELCHGEILKNLRDNINSKMQEKMVQLIEWMIEQQKGYKLVHNITEGRIELWMYTDQRFDDLISPPVSDPFSKFKVALGRLSEDFPLLADMRKYKSQLYDNMDLVMTYLNEVAEPKFEEAMYDSSGPNLEDLWSWRAMINNFFCELLGRSSMKGQAFLVGNQHYKTFDGSYYEFAGKCSFLLAQDFDENTFTVAVEYNREEEIMSRSFVVIADGATIELHDNRVFIGRDDLELPYVVSPTTFITRDADNIYIISKGRFTITYNLRWDMFSVELSILYFGKTAGLFGNFNFEPNDDMVDSSGNIRPELDEFARTWEIGKKCTSHLNKASSVCDISPSLQENSDCAATFLDGLGPASNGHPAVNPEPYYTMCAKIRCINQTYEEFGKQLCGIFNAYVQECRRKGLTWIEMLKPCMYCPLSEDSSVPYYPSRVDVPRGSDVVVVLEQKLYMGEESQQVIDLIDRVNTELKREGYRDNRYGIVGFGGADVHEAAYAETIDGELFGPAQGLQRSLSRMQFDGEGTSDAWAAISVAMNYPFRAGVAKHIVFVACSLCPERSSTAGSLRIQKAMRDQDIKLTMIIDHSFNLGEKSEKEDDAIFGIDNFAVYTDKLAGIEIDYFKGDSSLLQYVNQPKNPLPRLALATDGALFSTDSMNSKKFKDVFALWMVKHSFTDDTAICTCVEQNGFTRSVCE